jgi:hypothetical protein
MAFDNALNKNVDLIFNTSRSDLNVNFDLPAAYFLHTGNYEPEIINEEIERSTKLKNNNQQSEEK